MLINQTFEIDSCDDVELNIKRTSKLEYRISYDDEKEIKAIVFIIGGFGANVNISFLDFDREYIAKNFDVVAVHVFIIVFVKDVQMLRNIVLLQCLQKMMCQFISGFIGNRC